VFVDRLVLRTRRLGRLRAGGHQEAYRYQEHDAGNQDAGTEGSPRWTRVEFRCSTGASVEKVNPLWQSRSCRHAMCQDSHAVFWV
jgi:hypothetical protein